jgi:hypothetical protein
MKENEMGWVCTAHGEMRNAYNFFLESLKGRDHLEGIVVDVRII